MYVTESQNDGFPYARAGLWTRWVTSLAQSQK